MLRTEIAELMKDSGKMYEIAEKATYNLKLSNEEKEIFEVSDAWAKEIGKTGNDKDHEIAQYVQRVVQEEIYNTPDELLDLLFDRGSIGEFDDVVNTTIAKNTLIAHKSAKGGVVDKSYLDIRQIAPTYTNRQVDTQLSFVDLRKNGFKSVALLTTYAQEALKNRLFNDVFGQIDTALTAGTQVFDVSGNVPTKTVMDSLAMYCVDRDVNSVAVGLSKYMQAIPDISGYNAFMSDTMKDDFNRYGLTQLYKGVKLAGISSAKKQGNGELLIPDRRIFGCAGKIGTLDMRGEIHVYEQEDVQSEKINIFVKDFEYGVAITDLDKVCKVTFSA